MTAVGQPQSLGSSLTMLRAACLTVVVVALLVLWPAFAFGRYREISEANLGFQLQPQDPLLLVTGVIWLGVLYTLVAGLRSPRRIPTSTNDLKDAFGRVLEPTYFGAGDFRGWTATSTAASLANLEFPEEEDVAEPLGEFREPRGEANESSPEAVVAERIDPALASVTTVEYTVQRRDSWWSIAETVVESSRDWSTIRALNLGREMPGGVIIEEDTVLRSGWKLLVPLEPTQSSATPGS